MPTDDPRFISLADVLRSARLAPAPIPAAAPAPELPPHPDPSYPSAAGLGAPEAADGPARAISPLPQPAGCACEHGAALRDARLFRAALADGLEFVLSQLALGLASEVLGRELRLEPADLGAIAQRLILERRTDDPLRVRVAPADADVACELPTIVDPRLVRGDAVLECRSGDIDARLAVRLAALVAAVELP